MISVLNKSIVFLIIILAISISFSPMLVDSVIIILATFCALLVFIGSKFSVLNFLKRYYPLILFFSVLAFGMLYTNDFKRGFSQIEKNLAFVALPFCFFTVKDLLNPQKVIAYFSYGVVLSALFCDIMLKINHNGFFTFGYTILLEPLDLDPTYFSMYAVLAISYFTKALLLKNTHRLFNITLIFYLLFFYLRVGSKIGILLLFVCVIIFGVLFLRQQPLKTILLIPFVLLILLLVSFYTPLIYNRFYAPLLENNLDFYQLRLKFFNERFYAWKCSFEAINIKSFWLGYGTGDDIDVLGNCYQNYRRDFRLNPHNTYFSILLKNGLLGLISFFLIIRKGLNTKKVAYIVFFSIILFTSLTESILERQKGIIFFTLICTLVLTDLQQTRDNKCAE